MKLSRSPWLGAILVVGLLRCAVAAETNAPAVVPVPRTDRNSQLAHEQLLAKARQGGIDLYFVGDSIIRRWGCSDAQYRDLLANWTTNFHGWNAGNFGWGSDTVQNILWRLENGELAGVRPKVVVLLAGTNNLKPGDTGERAEAKIAEVVAGIRAILDSVQRQAPAATVILMGVLPRNSPGEGLTLMPTIRRLNSRLAGFADGKRIRYLDLDARLADRDGQLLAGMMHDGVHPTVQGYQVWADALKPILTELLGPPAKEDHAPPPTGDPGATVKP